MAAPAVWMGSHATGGRLDWYASLPPFLHPLSPALDLQWGGSQSPTNRASGVLRFSHPQAPSLQAGGRGLTSAHSLTRELGSPHCFTQCISSHLPPSGAEKPGGLQAPAQFTVVDFCSASRLQKHALEPKPAKPSHCSFCVSWTTAVPSRDGVPASTDFKMIPTSPVSYTLATLVRG